MRLDMARTIFISALAATLFGVFLVVAPRLTASGSEAVTITTTAAAAPVTATAVVTAITVATTMPPVTTTAVTMPPAATIWDPAAMTAENGYDGTVDLRATATGSDGTEVVDRGPAEWTLTVTNTTDGLLWGLFAYVEGFGPANCETRRMAPLSAAVCRAEGTAWLDGTPVVAWVNAWTEDGQVKDMVLVDLVVLP